MNPAHLSRRNLLKSAALGALALPTLASRATAAAAPAPAAPAKQESLRLGVASYSLRNLPLDEAIAAVKTLRIANIALFRLHCNWEAASVDECSAVGAKLKAAGLALSGSGVVNLPNDEAKCRKAFENVRAAGMATMVCKPDLAALPLVEKLAKEFDQKLAIHNHGPEDKVYPTPEVIWNAVKNLDARIGLCIDVGHTERFGDGAAAAIRKYAARLYDVHLKDSIAVVGAQRDVPIEVGAGRLDIPGMLRALVDVKYKGVVAFEYEKAAGNPVTGLAESVGYVRGLLAAMAKS
ncbi:MAG: sugar phosphate isomerase/epimerase [Opitutaceae bacterium]|nr:sugar phosphate isomerase/epimerase [Opitutaceae bacterium]